MRKLFSKTTLAAILGIAITFTLSCSSGGDDNNNTGGPGGNSGSNLSDLPKEVFFADWDDDGNITREKYNGNGEIELLLYLRDEDGETTLSEYKPAGNVKNGQVSLNLPDVDSKYLLNKEAFCTRSAWGDSKCAFSINPENIVLFSTQGFRAIIPNKNDCGIRPQLIDGGVGAYKRSRRDVGLFYSSGTGKITGKSCRTGDEGNTVCNNYDVNLSKGWNIVYAYNDANGMNATTNLSKTGGTLEWWIRGCDE